MQKKLFIILLTAILVTSVLVGCSNITPTEPVTTVTVTKTVTVTPETIPEPTVTVTTTTTPSSTPTITPKTEETPVTPSETPKPKTYKDYPEEVLPDGSKQWRDESGKVIATAQPDNYVDPRYRLNNINGEYKITGTIINIHLLCWCDMSKATREPLPETPSQLPNSKMTMEVKISPTPVHRINGPLTVIDAAEYDLSYNLKYDTAKILPMLRSITNEFVYVCCEIAAASDIKYSFSFGIPRAEIINGSSRLIHSSGIIRGE